MNWRDKLQIARNAAKTVPEMGIVFAARQGMDAAHRDSLLSRHPYIDREYLLFLKETDGLQVDMYQLFGSEVSGLTPISQAVRRWKPIIGDEGVPIGEDPSGDCIVLCKDGRIRLVSSQMDSVADGREVADSFSSFLSDILMGPLFPTLFPNGFSSKHENEWTSFLREQHWLGETAAT